MSSLRVKVTPQQPALEGKDFLEITVSSSSTTILQIKTLLRVKLGLPADKQIRLIFQGRLLSEDDKTLDSLNFRLADQFLHAVISNAPPSASATTPSSSATTATASASTPGRVFSLPASAPPAEGASGSLPVPRGLNRLNCPQYMAEVGLPPFSLEVVQQLRLSFREELDTMELTLRRTLQNRERERERDRDEEEEAGDNDPLLSRGDGRSTSTSSSDGSPAATATEVTREDAEELWLTERLPSLRLASMIFSDSLEGESANGHMPASFTYYSDADRPSRSLFFSRLMGSGSTSGGIGSGPTNRGQSLDFFYGVLLGYFFGFILIFCLFDRSTSPRLRSGIYVGIILQIVSNVAFSYATSSAVGDGDKNSGGNLRGTDGY